MIDAPLTFVPTSFARRMETADDALSPRSSHRDRGQVSLLSVTTTVLWLGCATISLLGLWLSYERPHAPDKILPPLQAQVLDVELTKDPAPVLSSTPASADLSQPPPLRDLALPPATPLVAVAAPSPVIAFALPVDGPVRIVEAKQAGYVRDLDPKPATPVAAAPVRTITYGQGEGRQPAPEYPARAVREGQEGTVRVRFSVGENGRVLEAEAWAACPWRLLNEAAVRAVRERWRFPAGLVRRYEVAIRFELTK